MRHLETKNPASYLLRIVFASDESEPSHDTLILKESVQARICLPAWLPCIPHPHPTQHEQRKGIMPLRPSSRATVGPEIDKDTLLKRLPIGSKECIKNESVECVNLLVNILYASNEGSG